MNEETEKEKALELAKEKLPGFDTLIDLFDMTFVHITKESAQVSGYTPKEMIGRNISKFMAIPSNTSPFKETIMKSMVGGLVKIPVKTKDGKEKVVEMEHVVVEVNGHPYLATKAVISKKQGK